MLLLLACHPRIPEPAAEAPPTLEVLVTRFEEVRGANALATHTSLHVEGVVKGPRGEATYSAVHTADGRYRLDTRVEGRPFVVGCGRFDGWIFSGVDPRAMEPAEQRAVCATVGMWDPIEGTATSVVADRIAERDTWHATVEEPGQPVRGFWFDQDDGLMVARSWRVSGTDLVEHQLDWRDFDGVMLPNTVVSVQGEQTFEKTSVTWDRELPEFGMPDVF